MATGGSAARRYADAMLGLAGDDAERAVLRTSLERVADITSARQLRLLRDPGVTLARRRAAARAVTEAEPQTVRSLLGLLVERDRVALLPAISAAYAELLDEREGIAKARITTAVEIDGPQRQAVVERLAAATGKKIQATFDVDASLLGGLKVRVGDRLTDISVRAQLERMRAALAGGR